MVGLRTQSTLRIQGFHVLGFNQPWIKNIQKKKKNSRKLEKAKLEFTMSLQLVT